MTSLKLSPSAVMLALPELTRGHRRVWFLTIDGHGAPNDNHAADDARGSRV